MIGGIDLHRRADLRSVADGHLDDIEDDAVEIEEHTRSQPNVEAVVAEEWWTNFRALADAPKPFPQEARTIGRQAGSFSQGSPFASSSAAPPTRSDSAICAVARQRPPDRHQASTACAYES